MNEDTGKDREQTEENLPSYFDKLLYGGFGKRLVAYGIDISIVGGVLIGLMLGYNALMGVKFLITPMNLPLYTYTQTSWTTTSFVYTLPDGRQGKYLEHDVMPFYYGLIPLGGYIKGELQQPGASNNSGSTALVWPKSYEVDRDKIIKFLYVKGLGRGNGKHPDDSLEDAYNPYKTMINAYPREELIEVLGEKYFGFVETKYWGFFLYLLYSIVMEGSRFQGTVGKRLMKLRVTDAKGGKISYDQAVFRNASKIVSGYLFLIGFLMVLWTERRQGLHDKLAKTVIVNDMHLDKVRADYAV